MNSEEKTLEKTNFSKDMKPTVSLMIENCYDFRWCFRCFFFNVAILWPQIVSASLAETLRCPKVSNITDTCEEGVEYECFSDGGCPDGTKCCPDPFPGDGGCALVCETPVIFGTEYEFCVCFVVISYPDLTLSLGMSHISSDRVRSGYEISFVVGLGWVTAPVACWARKHITLSTW